MFSNFIGRDSSLRKLSLVFLCFLLASSLSFSQTEKWDPEDWDDDGVLNVNDGDSEVDSLDPTKAPNSHGRALILSWIKDDGIELPLPERFRPDKSFIIEFWYSPVSDGGGANGTFFKYSDDSSSYKLYCENSKVKVDFDGVNLEMAGVLAR